MGSKEKKQANWKRQAKFQTLMEKSAGNLQDTKWAPITQHYTTTRASALHATLNKNKSTSGLFAAKLHMEIHHLFKRYSHLVTIMLKITDGTP